MANRISIEQAVRLSGVSRATIYRLIERGKLKRAPGRPGLREAWLDLRVFERWNRNKRESDG